MANFGRLGGCRTSALGRVVQLTIFEYEFVKAKRDALNERLSRIKMDMDRMKLAKKI